MLDYIDRQLSGEWGAGAGKYQQGPFKRPGHAGHGWQSSFTPAEAYRYGLATLAEHTKQHYGAHFSNLTPADQDDVLRDLSADRIEQYTELAGSDFFALLRQNVIEGLFSDPMYGGNHEMLGWRWIGYPGVASLHGDDYQNHIDKFGEPYIAEPQALP